MTRRPDCGNDRTELWDAEDEFFYDVLRPPDGGQHKLKVPSTAGFIPLFAVETPEPEALERLPGCKRRLEWFLKYRPDLAALLSNWEVEDRGRRRLLSVTHGHRMKQLLRRMLDESEFLSDHGVRALFRAHAEHPYTLKLGWS